MTWKISAFAAKPVIQTALAAHETMDDWDYDIVLTGSEIAEDKPDDWVLEAYMPRKPTQADRAAVASLFSGVTTPKLHQEQLPDVDWVTETQRQWPPFGPGDSMSTPAITPPPTKQAWSIS